MSSPSTKQVNFVKYVCYDFDNTHVNKHICIQREQSNAVGQGPIHALALAAYINFLQIRIFFYINPFYYYILLVM